MKRLGINGALWIGLLLLLILVVTVILPEFLTLRDPQLAQLSGVVDGVRKGPPFDPGELGYPLGTDILGRDRLSRLIYGARVTLAIALSITLLRAILAIPLGLAAGWYQGWLSRFVSLFGVGLGAIPTLVLVALTLAALRMMVTDPMSWLLIFVGVVTFVSLPRMAEHVRTRTREIALQAHVESAISVGATSGRIMRRHILPIMTADLLIMLSAEMAWALLMMGQLAVLGIYVGGTGVLVNFVGLPERVAEYWPEWAMMMGHSRGAILSKAWIPLLPGMALATAAICFHLLAEGLRIHFLRK